MVTSQDFQFFAVVAASQSLAAAARELGVTPSAVTQRLRQLEQRLRVRLVERSSRRLSLTEEGALLAARGSAVLAQIDGIADELARRSACVTGRLRVAAPFGFGRAHVAPVMAAMRSQHPEVELVLWLFQDPANGLSADSWDVMIHVGPLADSSLTLRRLAPNRRILCAAPSYVELHGAPTRPDDLAAHVCGVIREDQADASLWTFSGEGGVVRTVRIAPAFASNDGEVIRAWAKAGLGIIVRSEWSVAEDLQIGRLVELLPGWSLPNADVVALLGSRTERLARTSTFLDIMMDALAPAPWRARL